MKTKNIGEFKIESGIEIPKPKGFTFNIYGEVISNLEIGDSLEVTHNQLCSLYNYIKRNRLSIKLSSRRSIVNGKKVIRVWRVS